MKPLILLFMFVGMFLIVNGIYEQKLKAAENNKRVEYRFVPRTFYDEQLSYNSGDVTLKTANMFNHASPWFDRNVGAGLDVLKTDAK